MPTIIEFRDVHSLIAAKRFEPTSAAPEVLKLLTGHLCICAT